MADFREVLDFCELRDIGFSWIPWTYDNRKEGPRNVKVRLDRGWQLRSGSIVFLCFYYSPYVALL
jgi:hypothetical protein